MSGIDSNLGTMVINEEEEDSTMKQYGTAPGGSKYRYCCNYQNISILNFFFVKAFEGIFEIRT